ncbi:MAG TPA: CARDB domain-containing protein [Candidatus Thermoplasmatota archaeon]|nr:CARDB domain-containing protein [Candidatus Thermoplasmatota archaeon]
MDPPGREGTPEMRYPPPRDIAAAPALSGPNAAMFLDRPLQFGADGDVFLFAGLVDGLPRISGPLGGADAGRRFAGAGPVLLYAPYGNTVVEASLVVGGPRTLRLGAQQVELLDGAAMAAGFRLEASRPILAYPLRVTPGTLAALPTFLPAVAGTAQFRGHMVDIASPTGLDPITGSTLVETPITYRLRVTNLGRDATGAGLTDTIDLRVTPAHDGWSADLGGREAVELAGGESLDLQLTVRPSSGVEPGSLAVFQVTATSRGTPARSDTLSTVTYLQSSYDVDLRFADGRKVATQSIEAGGAWEYPLVLTNEGSVEDTVNLEVTTPAEGWRASLFHGGDPVRSVVIDPGEENALRLTLHVTPPPGQSDGVLLTTVTARGSNGAQDRATAITRQRAPSDLSLKVEREQALVLPGEEGLFRVTVTNDGRGGADVALASHADRVRGWTSLGTFVAPGGARMNLTQITLSPGESFTFLAGLRAPATALAGQAVGMQLVAQTRDGRDRAETFVHAMVRPLHRLDPALPPLPLSSESGFDQIGVPLRLTNRGNLDERLSVRLRDLPAGWHLGVPPQLVVPRNATQPLALNLTVPAGQAPGLYNLTVDFLSRDGNATSIRLPVAVGSLARAGTASTVSVVVAAQPGRAARLQVPVRNEGNVPLEVRVLPAATEPWRLTPGHRPFLLPPGANASVEVSWDVPATAPDGASRHIARIATAPPGGEPRLRDVEATVAVGRADLAPAGFRSYAGPAGTLLEGRIANTGARTAPPFVVRLMVGQVPIEDLRVEGLAPGDNATVRLLLPRGQAGSPAVLVDAESAVVESNEMNNAVSLDEAGRPASASGLLAILAILAVAMARTPKVRTR